MTTKTILFSALWVFIATPPGMAAEERKFEHPGIISTQDGLDSLKARLKSNPAARLGHDQLKRSKYAALSRPHTPYAAVKVVASGSSKEEIAFRGDAQAARATALMWVMNGDARYRDKAISILNDWSSTYQTIKSSMPDKSHQVWLECAWAVPIWTAAADIIRYHDHGAAGWKKTEIASFDRFLNAMVGTAGHALKNNNNWGTSATLAVMSAAVYQEDGAAYAEALRMHKQHLSSISKPSGALGPDYLRDPWHPQYTILTWIQICELAWNQGDDLYGIQLDGQSIPRLAICLEHFSKLFLGKLPNPKGLEKGNYKDSHRKRQGYDMAYNHFIHRKGLATAMPTFTAMVPDWRPGGIDTHFLGWDTLTHAELDAGKHR